MFAADSSFLQNFSLKKKKIHGLYLENSQILLSPGNDACWKLISPIPKH